MHIVHLVSHPIQYFVPIYREIEKSGSVQLTVAFGSRHGIGKSFDAGIGLEVEYGTELLAGYHSLFLQNVGSGTPDGDVSSFDCPTLAADWQSLHPDLLWIHGWGYRFHRQAADWARSRRIPYLLRGETTLLDAPRFSMRWIRRVWLYRSMFHRAAGLLYVGEQNKRFYQSMGIDSSNLFPMHYSIDTEHFRPKNSQSKQLDSERFVVVTLAKLIARKRIHDLISAMERCDSNTELWVLGEGQDRQSLESQAAPLGDRVRFFGFTSQSDIPEIFSQANLFVLASSEETWGLVINEAMACGLPAMVSDQCGCATDLVSDGTTGSMFTCGDIDSLASKINAYSINRPLAKQHGQAARLRIESSYNSAASARQLESAASTILSRLAK